MQAVSHEAGLGRFWLTVWSACALLPLALGWGRCRLAVLCVLPVIGTFAGLQWTGRGSYARAALRCVGFAWGVLSLVDLGRACQRAFPSRPLLLAGEVLGQYGRSLPRLALLSLLAALLGLLVSALAHLRRQRRGQPRWYTTPLASDPHLRGAYRRIGDAALLFGCLFVYGDLWLGHQETVLRQASPLWDVQAVYQRALHAHGHGLRQAAQELEAVLLARLTWELPYDALVAGFTGVLLFSAAHVAIQTRRRLSVSGPLLGADRRRVPSTGVCTGASDHVRVRQGRREAVLPCWRGTDATGGRPCCLALLCGLLGLLAPGGPAWPQARQALPPAPRLHVVVHQGRLSVDLHEAEVSAVFARLHHQAGIAVVGPVAPGLRLSTRFTHLTLADGLRRVLRVAGLNYALVSAQDHAGTRPIQTVYVLGAPGGVPPSQLPTARRELTPPEDLAARRVEQVLLASFPAIHRPDGAAESESDEELQRLVVCVPLRNPWGPLGVLPDADAPEGEELEPEAPEGEELEPEAPEGEEPEPDDPDEEELADDRPTP